MCINEKYISRENQKRSDIYWIKMVDFIMKHPVDEFPLQLFVLGWPKLGLILFLLTPRLSRHLFGFCAACFTRTHTCEREREREKLSFSSYFFYPSCSPFSSCALLFHFFFSYAFLLPLFYTRFILRLAWAFIYSWLCFFYNCLFVSLWYLVNPRELEFYFLW